MLKIYKIDTLAGIDFAAVSDIVKSIIKLDKGAIVIFIKRKVEFNNLCKKCRVFELNPPQSRTDLLKYISKIDGAIICNYSGSILGYGAILDGKAQSKANLQRGSRFNSSKTYIDNIENSFGIVRSGDGMIDVIVHNKKKSVGLLVCLC